MANFEIEFLDHVAIRVQDLEASVEWYKKVLGLKVAQFQEWGAFPIMLFAGKTGIALFPKSTKTTETKAINFQSDHFAFNLTNENFAKARKWYDLNEITYDFQDHHYFHSIYTKDPDNYLVELTTLVVEESKFYQNNANTKT